MIWLKGRHAGINGDVVCKEIRAKRKLYTHRRRREYFIYLNKYEKCLSYVFAITFSTWISQPLEKYCSFQTDGFRAVRQQIVLLDKRVARQS